MLATYVISSAKLQFDFSLVIIRKHYLDSLNTLFRIKIEKIGGKYQHNMQSKIKKGYTEASYRKVSFSLLFGHFTWAYMSLGHFPILFPYPVSCHLHSWCNDPSEEFPSYFSVFSFSPILTFSACAWVGDVNWNNSLLVAMPLRKMAALPPSIL